MVIKWIVIVVCVYILIGIIYAYRFMAKELPELLRNEMDEKDEYFTVMNKARNETHVYMEEMNQMVGKKGSKVVHFLIGTFLWLPLVIDTEISSRREAAKWMEDEEFYDHDEEEIDPKRFACPCCGYPTLEIQNYGYEVCILCGWEDDGQRDDQADKVWGGANQEYSLTVAKEIFKQHFLGYHDNKVLKSQKREAVIHANKQLMEAYDQLEKPKNWTTEGISLGTDKKWEEVFKQEAALGTIKYKK
ncbi:CPCC family cysteine-rich protein [Paenibacillus sp. GYB006]|uniref:CPCC family cysteine-rich protein n=1 Tax=Paenibacillus sp. GYB006 TaxID=2994394 RepID=UPI002F962AB9